MENIFFKAENLVERLKLFMQSYKLNQSELAKELGYKSSEKISRLFRKDGANPSVDIILDISNKFEDLNIEWLLTGNGLMKKEESLNDLMSKQLKENDLFIQFLRERITKLEKQIISLGYKPIE